MAQQHDDLCIVCAEPLEFTAFGSCGHNEVCTRCVARMRFVLQDKGCCFCRQENAQVYFTRFMGDYTVRLAPEDFTKLQSRADRRELFVMPEINGYFDDERHFQEIRTLCGYTHPILNSAGGKAAPKFNNFNALKRHIETTHNQFFCDVCVKGRKVFVSEQLLYTKETLRRHQDVGDESGPLAESGFKGHPPCKFCRTRFYDSNELYRHMEGSHEHCFLCRRAAPDKYVYYRHYKELEEHFTKDHHPCPHPTCLERKFVVFSTEYELKAHFASEHGDEVKMSAAQRRQALTIPLQLQFRSRDDDETEPSAHAHLERAAVVIGGGHNIGSRAARSGRGAGGGSGGMHHSRSEPQFAPVQDTAPDVSSVTFTAEDFPAPSSSQQAGAGPLGRWAAFTGAQASAGGLSDQDFPSLPSLSKNQRRRIKEQQRTLADRLSSAAQPPRVINRAAAPGAGAGAASGSAGAGAGPSASGPPAQAPPAAADFPALSSSAAGPSSSATAPAAPPPPSQAAASLVSSSARAADVVAPVAAQRRPPGFGRDEFPALGGSSRPTPTPPPPASAAYSGAAAGLTSSSSGPTGLSQAAVLNSLFMRPGSAAATAGALGGGGASASNAAAAAAAGAPADTTPQLTTEDFPSLPGGGKRPGKARIPLRKEPPQASPGKPGIGSGPAGGASASGDQARPAAAVAAAGGVSDSLKAANKALIERIKRQLSGSAFDSFRQQSQMFMRGELPAEEYHAYMVTLGLLSVVAELVSLCPEPTKRRHLLEVHRAFIASPAAQDPGLVGAGWMPPEAAVAKANRVAQHSAWGCARCSLINAPDDTRCESCKAPRPSEEEEIASALLAAVTLQPAQSGARSAAAAAAGSAGGFASSSGGFVPVRGQQQQPQQPAPPPVPVAEDFPSLMPSGGRRGGAAAPGAASVSKSAAVTSGNSNSDLGGAMDGSGADDFPSMASSSSGGGGKGKKGKGTTIKIGLPTGAGAGGGGGSRPHPQNVWTQPAFKAKASNQWSGQGAGKLAKMHGAINEAWE